MSLRQNSPTISTFVGDKKKGKKNGYHDSLHSRTGRSGSCSNRAYSGANTEVRRKLNEKV